MANVSEGMDQVVQEIITAYTVVEKNETPDTSPGTVNRDIIDAVADLVSNTFNDVEQTRLTCSLKNVALISDDALSQIGLGFDIVRLAATQATGVIFFQKTAVPTKIIDFPIGTVVQTQSANDGSFIQFVTTTAAQLNPQTTLNPVNRMYEASASIIASSVGTDSNVGPGSITMLATLNRNIDTIVNKAATSGGTNLEDSTTFANTILAKTTGSTLGTLGGYVSAIQSNFPSLVNVTIAGPNDPAMKRNQFGNEADAYIVGTSFSTFTDVISASGLSSDLLKTRPVVSLSSVTGVTNGGTYLLGTDVQFSKDTSPVFGGSVKAIDKITWLSGNRPGTTQQVAVSGLYDANVVAVNTFLNGDNVRYITLDILVKAASRAGIVIAANVISRSGFDRTSLASTIQTTVVNGISNFALGQSVFQSALVSMIGNVPGVDEVQIPFTQLRLTTDPVGTVSDVIAINTNTYARVDSATFLVS